jgi:pimeloyl-ACP methyl ester carboxylesterase
LAPKAELGWWYQYYFATERGRLGYGKNTYDLNKLIWRLASPKWNFDDPTFDRTATAFNNPDHAPLVIHNYRWRLSLALGDPKFNDLDNKLQTAPVITVPTVTIGSDFDGAAANGKFYRQKFSGKYSHLSLKGIGHNVPQEAPEIFAKAVIEVDGYS